MSKKLLIGYKNKDGETVEYSNLANLNPPAKKYLSADLESVYYLAFNPDDTNAYLWDFDKNGYIKLDDRILQEFLASKESIRLDINDTGKLIKSTVKRIYNNYDYIEFDNKLFNLKTYDYEDKTKTVTIKEKEYDTVHPRPYITPKRINHNILENKNKDFNPDNSITYRTVKQILCTEENIKDFKQRIGSTIFNKGKNNNIF